LLIKLKVLHLHITLKQDNMYYIITTQQGDQIKETDYFKAFRYSLFNKCILEQRNGSGVRVEINNFSNL